MKIPDQLSYTAEHEWVARDGETATVGITEFAAVALGEVVFLSLPEVGSTVSAGQTCGEIESTKSVSDLYAPADGVVVEVNSAVLDEANLVNDDPYGRGWLFRLRIDASPQWLDARAYRELIGTQG